MHTVDKHILKNDIKIISKELDKLLTEYKNLNEKLNELNKLIKNGGVKNE